MSTKSKPKYDPKKSVGTLAGMLLLVIQGLRSGSIKSNPILNIDPDAENYGMTTLEDEIWKALGKCGIIEKKQSTEAKK